MRAERTALPIPAVSRPGLVSPLMGMVAALWRVWRNRRALGRLKELSDWELLDIGLTREDVYTAYDTPILSDPTRHLQQIARARAREELVARRRA